MRPLAVVRAERQERAAFEDRLLQLVQQFPGETVVMLARRLGMDAETSSTLSQILKRFAREGVVTITPALRYFGKTFTLTEKGATMIRRTVTRYAPPRPLPLCSTQPVGTPDCPRCEKRQNVSALAKDGPYMHYACRSCEQTFEKLIAA
jgi:DNA-binding MarR family transcriptional regulator